MDPFRETNLRAIIRFLGEFEEFAGERNLDDEISLKALWGAHAKAIAEGKQLPVWPLFYNIRRRPKLSGFGRKDESGYPAFVTLSQLPDFLEAAHLASGVYSFNLRVKELEEAQRELIAPAPVPEIAELPPAAVPAEPLAALSSAFQQLAEIDHLTIEPTSQRKAVVSLMECVVESFKPFDENTWQKLISSAAVSSNLPIRQQAAMADFFGEAISSDNLLTVRAIHNCLIAHEFNEGYAYVSHDCKIVFISPSHSRLALFFVAEMEEPDRALHVASTLILHFGVDPAGLSEVEENLTEGLQELRNCMQTDTNVASFLGKFEPSEIWYLFANLMACLGMLPSAVDVQGQVINYIIIHDEPPLATLISILIFVASECMYLFTLRSALILLF